MSRKTRQRLETAAVILFLILLAISPIIGYMARGPFKVFFHW